MVPLATHTFLKIILRYFSYKDFGATEFYIISSQVKTQFKRETKLRTIRSLTGLTAIAERECRAAVGAAVRALKCTRDRSKPIKYKRLAILFIF